MSTLVILERTKKYWLDGDVQTFKDGWATRTTITDIVCSGSVLCIRGQQFNIGLHLAIAMVVNGPEHDWVYIQHGSDFVRIRPSLAYRWVIPKRKTIRQLAALKTRLR